MAAGDLVLLTGATGHLGFRTLLYTLQAGYTVRAAVRSSKKADIITSNPAFKALNLPSSQLSFVTVPDFLADHAFDEAVKDVRYIIHVASPIPSAEPEDGDYNKFFIQPAVRGTLGVFESAQKVSSVKRIVVTSSVVAQTGPTFGAGKPEGIKRTDRQETNHGPFDNGLVAYVYSKVAALNEAESWLAKNKPAWDVVHVHPSFIFGRDELADSTEYFKSGTNHYVTDIPLGQASEKQPLPVTFTHVNDSAEAHVLALNTAKVAGNQSFILSSSGDEDQHWTDIVTIAGERYPELVKDGVFKGKEPWGEVPAKFHTQETVELLGRPLASLENATVSVLDHWVELYKKEQASK
jgi:nucleoside-diphosphate-sugar epimerase